MPTSPRTRFYLLLLRNSKDSEGTAHDRRSPTKPTNPIAPPPKRTFLTKIPLHTSAYGIGQAGVEVTVIRARYQRAQRYQRSAIPACEHISKLAFRHASIQITAFSKLACQHSDYSIQHSDYSIHHTDYSIQQASIPAFRLQHTAYRLQHTAS